MSLQKNTQSQKNKSGQRQLLGKSKRWVVKIGSALLTNNGKGLDLAAMAQWVDQMAQLRQQGVKLVLVSSGAVAEGMSRLGLNQRPDQMHTLQAAAAVGQMGLIQAYEAQFKRHNLQTAQILLTHEDLSDRKRYLNARNTLLALLDLGVVPVVNENDTVVTDEIRFGDNDTLAALVSNLVQADGMIILTDQAGMYESDPRDNPDALIINEARANDEKLRSMATGSKSGLGRGGMSTKVDAAALAARSGSYTVIAGGREDNILNRLYSGEQLGTLLVADKEPLAARKQWLAGHLQMRGELILDPGAVKVLKNSGKSLLSVGVKSVKGQFERGEMVVCLDESGTRIACGLVNYSSQAAEKIAGKNSENIADILGYSEEPELIHRDNIVVF